MPRILLFLAFVFFGLGCAQSPGPAPSGKSADLQPKIVYRSVSAESSVQSVSDEAIEDSIHKILYLLPFGQWSRLEVNVQDGKVQLAGEIDQDMPLGALLAAVANLKGVRNIESQSVVKTESSDSGRNEGSGSLLWRILRPLLILFLLGLLIVIGISVEVALIKRKLKERRDLRDHHVGPHGSLIPS